MGSIPPLSFPRYLCTWKHICKLEADNHNDTSSVVHIYPLFLLFYLWFFFLYHFDDLQVRTPSIPFSPIPDKKSLYFSSHFFISIFSAFNRRASISLSYGEISSRLFALFTLCDNFLFCTVQMSSFPLSPFT